MSDTAQAKTDSAHEQLVIAVINSKEMPSSAAALPSGCSLNGA